MAKKSEAPTQDKPKNDLLQNLLQQHFALKDFRVGQRLILESVLKKNDTLAVMPTGGGKSLCYQLPAVHFKGIVVVISPLIALMKDQVENLKRLGIPAGAVNSSQTPEEKKEVFRLLSRSEHFVLYVSPERVQKDGFGEWIKNKNISLFAIDEAHCVSQWGPDFREDYHRLNLLRQLCPKVPILALTATATPQVLDDVSQHLGLRTPDRHIYGFYRKNLFYQVVLCDDDAEKLQYAKQALEQTPKGRVIIYCGTRRQTENICSSLKRSFSDVSYYHAGLSPEERTRIQNEFSQSKVRILTATNAFGMGIDHPDVRLVIHFQMPANIESFYQEMGRAGRDGEDSTCLLLYSKKDKGLHAYFINSSRAQPKTIKQRWKALDAITQFAEGGECRHAGILTYFRDTHRIEACGHCDICDAASPRLIRKPQEPEQKIKTIKRTKKDRGLVSLDTPLSPEQEVRAEVLKTWRKQYAETNDIPAFVVFSNRTLHDLAVKNPQTLSDLQNVYGMGPHKVEHLGSEILAQLKSSSI